MDPRRRQRLVEGRRVESFENFAGGANRFWITGHVEFAAAAVDGHPEAAFELTEVLVERPAEIRQALIVCRLQRNVASVRQFAL